MKSSGLKVGLCLFLSFSQLSCMFVVSAVTSWPLAWPVFSTVCFHDHSPGSERSRRQRRGTVLRSNTLLLLANWHKHALSDRTSSHWGCFRHSLWVSESNSSCKTYKVRAAILHFFFYLTMYCKITVAGIPSNIKRRLYNIFSYFLCICYDFLIIIFK